MKNTDRVFKEMKRLESMIPSGFMGIGDHWDFKALWAQIKAVQGAFNEARFPTREEHQEAWTSFQNLVDQVKEKQAKNRAESAELRDQIVGKAERIPPIDDRWAKFFFALGTMGVGLVLLEVIESLVGVSDSRKEALQNANKDLQELRDLAKAQNDNLLREDKDKVYQALRSANERLQEAWDQWKQVREEKSAELRNQIVGMAENAVPHEWEELVRIIGGAYLTDGYSLLLELLEDGKAKLQAQREKLQEVWAFFKSEKNNLLPADRQTVYQALRDAESRLQGGWGQYSSARDKCDEVRRKKREAWRNKVEGNLSKNQQRSDKLNGVLERKRQNLENNQVRIGKLENALERKRQNLENNQVRIGKLENALERKRQHLDELYEKISDARSDSYRERVEGWIEEEESSIEDIEAQLERVNGWIEEDDSSIEDIEAQLERVNGWIEEDDSSIKDIEAQLERVNDWIQEDSRTLNS